MPIYTISEMKWKFINFHLSVSSQLPLKFVLADSSRWNAILKSKLAIASRMPFFAAASANTPELPVFLGHKMLW